MSLLQLPATTALRAAACFALACWALPAAHGDDSVISRSPDLALTAATYRAYLTQNPAIDREKLLADENLLRDLVMDFHSDLGLSREAKALNLDEIPAVKGELERARTGILVQALMNGLVRDLDYPDMDRLARERYLANRDKHRLPEKRKVRLILLTPNPYPCRETRCAPETTAQAVLEELQAGTDFAELASRYSMDVGTACAGGLLNRWLTPEDRRVAQAVRDAAFGLEAVGDISEPLVTVSGTLIIRLEALEEGRQLEFEEVRDRIVEQLKSQYRSSQLEQKRATAYPDWKTVDYDALRALLAEAPEQQ